MNKQILVVDDSMDTQQLVRTILGDQDIDLHSAADPQYGLTLAASIKPDLILLDVDMPGMDGYEFCRRLKADSSLWAVPVVFLTGEGNVEHKVRGLELGAMDYVTKPFSFSELRARVRAALRTQARIQILEDRARIDILTGLGNKKMLMERLRGEVSGRTRSSRPLTCSYIDLDGFRAINKYYGFPFGDEVLKTVGQILLDSYRPEDIVCRLRADDFVVLTPDTKMHEAVKMARAFKGALAKAEFVYHESKIPVTCGIVITNARGLYDQNLVRRAMAKLEGLVDRRSDGFWAERDDQAENESLAA